MQTSNPSKSHLISLSSSFPGFRSIYVYSLGLRQLLDVVVLRMSLSNQLITKETHQWLKKRLSVFLYPGWCTIFFIGPRNLYNRNFITARRGSERNVREKGRADGVTMEYGMQWEIIARLPEDSLTLLNIASQCRASSPSSLLSSPFLPLPEQLDSSCYWLDYFHFVISASFSPVPPWLLP